MNLLCTVCLWALFISWVSAEIGGKQKDDLRDIGSEDGLLSGVEMPAKRFRPADNSARFETWVLSLIASCVIGLSGIVPLIFIPIETGLKLNYAKGGTKCLRLLLSFAVGGLLGDVFLHLLPEAWKHQKNLGTDEHTNHVSLGISVLLGMFSFIILEMIFTATQSNKMCNVPEPGSKYSDARSSCSEELHSGRSVSLSKGKDPSCDTSSGVSCLQRTDLQNGHQKAEPSQNGSAVAAKSANGSSTIHVTGYLNLMANSIDNFTHGLAVAASFLVGCKMGVLTTFAILIHEIPHEIGDFAILLKSGFHPWSAAKAQISTATIGVLGVVVALSAESIEHVDVCTSWILPFTAGGFLNIALVNVLPDLLNEKDPWESVKQFICLCAGIGVMACVGLFV